MRIIPAEAGDKSASVFIILIFLWCFCWFNLWTFGKTLPEFVFLTQDRIETHCVLLFFWEGGFISELCEENEHHESLWKQKWQMESEGIFFFLKKPCSNNQCAFKKTSLTPNCTNRDSECQSYTFLFDFLQSQHRHSVSYAGRVSSLTKQIHEYRLWPWNDSVLYL